MKHLCLLILVAIGFGIASPVIVGGFLYQSTASAFMFGRGLAMLGWQTLRKVAK